MEEINAKIKKFYNNEVILKSDKVSELRDKKEKNLDRLKEGIIKYNDDNETDYILKDDVTQGSIAMCTAIEPEYDDFDIDVGIIFDSDIIPADTNETKNLIINFLKPYNYLFKENPIKKKNCIRINYADNYHLDFAIYREKDNGKYEHCGETWTERDPWAINDWFKEKNKEYNGNLRKIVRLLKYFSKARKEWDICGGFIITILVSEQLEGANNIADLDELLLSIIGKIIDRLNSNQDIYNPTNNLCVTIDEKTKERVNNFKEKLDLFYFDLKVAYDARNKNTILKQWNKFFNCSYFDEDDERCLLAENDEMFIGDYYRINKIAPIELQIKCQRYVSTIQGDFNRSTHINCISGTPFHLSTEKSHMLCFSVETNVSLPYQLIWKIKNNGEKAYNQNMLRGELCTGNDINKNDNINSLKRYETIDFEGNHYVECYLIKDKLCLAYDKFDVIIK